MSFESLLAAHTAQDQKNFEKIDATLERMADTLEALKVQAAKDRGFIAGVSFVVGGIVALVSTFGSGLFTWLRG